MITRSRLLAGSALAAMLATAQSARADLIQWTLSGDYSDGGTFSGTFTYDNIADVYTAFNISTSGGTSGIGPNTYAPPGSQAFDSGDIDSFSTGLAYVVYAEFDNLPPGTPATVTPLTGDETAEICTPGCTPYATRTITSGTAVGTDIPEPASGALVLAGIGLLGVYRRRGRRGM
jgi:hypothetical protein